VVQRTVGLNKGAVFAGGAARPSLENAPCSTYPLVVVLCGAIVTMPGLPKEPLAWHVYGADGRRKVTGIK